MEVAGRMGTKGTIGPRFDQFDDGLGGSTRRGRISDFAMNRFVSRLRAA
jgi:hypothetical protein